MNARLRTLAGSGVVHVLFAFMAMGGWAVFANRAYPMPRPLVAGLVQGALSAMLTLFLKTGIDHLSKRFRGATAYWAPPLLVCLASTSLLVVMHALSGTPEILKTIAVPLAVSTSYAAVYAYSIAGKGDAT